MPDQITIEVINNTGKNQSFQLFNAVPASLAGSAYMNTWAQAPAINGSGDSATFQLTENFWAVCGDAPSQLANGVSVSTFNKEVANLAVGSVPGSNWRINIPDKVSCVFDPTTDAANANVPGGFQINTENEVWTDADDPTRFCGVGREDAHSGAGGKVVPTFVWSPDPNQLYSIKPTRIYYISYSYSLGGLAAEVSDLGQVATIDFTGKTETTASVTLGANFAFGTVTYA